MRNLLVTIIRQTFLKMAGKFQTNQERPKAFLVSFSLSVDYDKEGGYRQLDLLLYAPANYVQVWQRERWTVIPQEGLGYDEQNGDSFVKPGYDYEQGSSAWEMIGSHDSGYTSAIEDCLRQYERRIGVFEGGDWYRILTAPEGADPDSTWWQT